ncbi:hypothetical protein OPS25_00085 [Alteromonas ponticola]|uniref:Uncharacterized protein n=1 Tax=Alteromonas aquimaris TaxID=2998417 RepID=A0ABT3P2B3_9ALTE|nr:hypothetical protein [Alteromonas aquimaris]
MDSSVVSFRKCGTASGKPCLSEVYGFRSKPVINELDAPLAIADSEDSFETVVQNHRIVRRIPVR